MLESRIEQQLQRKDSKKDGIHSGIPPPSESFISVLITLYNMGDAFCFIREEGRSIQHELREISDIENQAVGE
jgi:hypothetical protein